MKQVVSEVWKQLLRLINFVTWYLVALLVFFQVLPFIGQFLQGRYEVMETSAKFFSVLGFFAVVAAWHIAGRKERINALAKDQDVMRIPSA